MEDIVRQSCVVQIRDFLKMALVKNVSPTLKLKVMVKYVEVTSVLKGKNSCHLVLVKTVQITRREELEAESVDQIHVQKERSFRLMVHANDVLQMR